MAKLGMYKSAKMWYHEDVTGNRDFFIPPHLGIYNSIRYNQQSASTIANRSLILVTKFRKPAKVEAVLFPTKKRHADNLGRSSASFNPSERISTVILSYFSKHYNPISSDQPGYTGLSGGNASPSNSIVTGCAQLRVTMRSQSSALSLAASSVSFFWWSGDLAPDRHPLGGDV